MNYTELTKLLKLNKKFRHLNKFNCDKIKGISIRNDFTLITIHIYYFGQAQSSSGERSNYFYDGYGRMVSYLYLGKDMKLYDEDEMKFNIYYKSNIEAKEFLDKIGLTKYLFKGN